MNILGEYYDISKDENNDYYILNGGKKIKSKKDISNSNNLIG